MVECTALDRQGKKVATFKADESKLAVLTIMIANIENQPATSITLIRDEIVELRDFLNILYPL